MKSIIVRNVPEAIHKELKLLAVAHEVSMNDLILELLAESLRIARSKNLDIIKKYIHEIEQIPIIDDEVKDV